MSEKQFVLYSAPTLAGIKTGNLFSVTYDDRRSFMNEIRDLNRVLVPKGIRVIPLKEIENKFLVYVYRPGSLQIDFHNELLKYILSELNYPISNADQCVVHLVKRLHESEKFPHEIGLFLGYSPEDVKGFIDNKAQNHKRVGAWKVYGDEQEAVRTFSGFQKCTSDYCLRVEQGITVEQLAVVL